MVTIKRVYDPATSDDGYRVLIERLWPRGVRKEAAHLDAWEKGIAPSDELRRWYGHDSEKWEEFQKRYQEELKDPAAQTILDDLAEWARRGTVTLVYAAREGEISNAAVLQRLLAQRVAGHSAKPEHVSK